MGAAARERCLARFEIGVVGAQWAELFGELAARLHRGDGSRQRSARPLTPSGVPNEGAAGDGMTTSADGPVGVLMLTKGLGRGGTERLLVDAVRHLDPARYRVEVAYLLPWKDALVDEIRDAGVPVHCLDAPHPTSVAWLGRLRQLVRAHDIAIVHTHMPSPAVAARLALRRPAGRRSSTPSTTCGAATGRLTRWANRLTYGRNRAVIAVSDGVAASIRSRVPVDVVLHGVEADRAPPRRDRPSVGAGVARPRRRRAGDRHGRQLHRQEGPRHAAAGGRRRAASRSRPCASCWSGRARSRPSCAGTVATLGLGRTWSSPARAATCPELLPAFDVFALSSRFEGLPIALLEAMATGLAVRRDHGRRDPRGGHRRARRACSSSRATRSPWPTRSSPCSTTPRRRERARPQRRRRAADFEVDRRGPPASSGSTTRRSGDAEHAPASSGAGDVARRGCS